MPGVLPLSVPVNENMEDQGFREPQRLSLWKGVLYRALILVTIALLIGLDQLFKYLAVVNLKGNPPIPLIKGVFELHYSENPGAAFGILQDHRWVFISVTIVVMIFLLCLLMSGKFSHLLLMNISASLIVAGGIGNLIDRIANGYVVDFLYFKLINFPIFNFADCCVVIGAVLLLVFFFFFYDDKPKLTRREETTEAKEEAGQEEATGAQAVKSEEAITEEQEAQGANGGETLDDSAGKGRGTP